MKQQGLEHWYLVCLHHPVDLYQVCLNYAPGAKMDMPRGHMYYIGLYREFMKKIFLSEITKPRALIFGM